MLQIPFADACVNQLLALAFGDTNGCEDVLWQGDVSGDLNEIYVTRAQVLTVCPQVLFTFQALIAMSTVHQSVPANGAATQLLCALAPKE